MSRRTTGKPPIATPRVILGQVPGGHRSRPKTLIGQASRALYVAGRAAEAEAMRALLLAAEPADYRPILCTFVEFWPAALVEQCATGNPARHWATSHIPPEQRRKDAA